MLDKKDLDILEKLAKILAENNLLPKNEEVRKELVKNLAQVLEKDPAFHPSKLQEHQFRKTLSLTMSMMDQNNLTGPNANPEKIAELFNAAKNPNAPGMDKTLKLQMKNILDKMLNKILDEKLKLKPELKNKPKEKRDEQLDKLVDHLFEKVRDIKPAQESLLAMMLVMKNKFDDPIAEMRRELYNIDTAGSIPPVVQCIPNGDQAGVLNLAASMGDSFEANKTKTESDMGDALGIHMTSILNDIADGIINDPVEKAFEDQMAPKSPFAIPTPTPFKNQP